MVKVPPLTSSGCKLAGAGPLRQVVDGPGQPEQRQAIRALDDRHDQAVLPERSGHADVDGAVQQEPFLGPGGVGQPGTALSPATMAAMK